MDSLERFMAGFAVLMSAAALGAAYLFRFDGAWASFDRLSRSLGFAFGPWVAAAVVAGLIWAAGNLMRFRTRLLELYFTLVCGACAVSILEALR
jgi:hypothetical protein